ncbi:MAG: Gfo/Idh/MocA family oxidoreductase [Chthonomonadales bacterium]
MTPITGRPVRIGFIGCGQISRKHLQAYKDIPNAEVIAGADINPEARDRVAAEFGIPHLYSDFRQMLQRDDIDAVDICLHNNFHLPATLAALEAGKHVYCEKPITGSHADAVTMVDAATGTDLLLHIQLATLYQNETRAAKELIEGGHLGNVYHARSTGYRRRGRPYVDGYGTPTFVQKRNAAGGAIYDMGVYHISQLLYLLDNPKVTRISGKTYQEIAMDEPRRADSVYDVEELGIGLVHFANNVTLDIIEAWAINIDSFEGSSIVGSKGGVRLDPFSFSCTFGDLDITGTANLDQTRYLWDKVRGDGVLYGSSQDHWIGALQGLIPLLPTAQLALNTMLISEGIYLSDRLGREVSADEVVKSSVSTAIGI